MSPRILRRLTSFALTLSAAVATTVIATSLTPAAAAPTTSSYACQSSFKYGSIDLTDDVFTIDTTVTSTLAATASAGSSYAIGTPSVQITAPADLLAVAYGEGYRTFKASSSTYKLNSTFGTTQGVHAIGTLNTTTASIPASGAASVSATGTATSFTLPAGYTGAGEIRTPDNSNTTDPWFASGASGTSHVAFLLAVTIGGGGKLNQNVLFRCGVDGVNLDGDVLQTVSVS